jgi:hypothetical protein
MEYAYKTPKARLTSNTSFMAFDSFSGCMTGKFEHSNCHLSKDLKDCPWFYPDRNSKGCLLPHLGRNSESCSA